MFNHYFVLNIRAKKNILSYKSRRCHSQHTFHIKYLLLYKFVVHIQQTTINIIICLGNYIMRVITPLTLAQNSRGSHFSSCILVSSGFSEFTQPSLLHIRCTCTSTAMPEDLKKQLIGQC